MTAVSYQYYFHAVGQGLFCSGQLSRLDNPNVQPFSWIVDCGTVSEFAFLRRERELFCDALNGQPIQLMCLSHFDEDHVNGAVELLSNYRVDSLILPYMPLVERLLIALEIGEEITTGFLQFLIDPAGYLFGVAGKNLGTVYFVCNSDSDSTSIVNSNDTQPSDGLDLRPPDSKPRLPPDLEDVRGSSHANPDLSIYVVGHNKPFTVSNLWEFMFYNECKAKHDLNKLRDAVIKMIETYSKPNGTLQGSELLTSLSALYSIYLGSSSQARNRISLLTYSGPILQSHHKATHPSSGIVLPTDGFPYGTPYLGPISPESGSKPSSLYMGDFPLTSTIRMKKIKKHFSQRRWKRIGILQVPHHGSNHSWFIGAAKYFEHNWSVFSANSTSKEHPSPIVVDDLKDRRPINVDETQRFVSSGQIKI